MHTPVSPHSPLRYALQLVNDLYSKQQHQIESVFSPPPPPTPPSLAWISPALTCRPFPLPPSPYPEDKWKCCRLQWVCVLPGSGIVRRARRKCSTPTVRSVVGRLARRKGRSLSPVTSVPPSITSTVISPLCGVFPGRLCAVHFGLFSVAGHVTKKWTRKTYVCTCHNRWTLKPIGCVTKSTHRQACACTHKHNMHMHTHTHTHNTHAAGRGIVSCSKRSAS